MEKFENKINKRCHAIVRRKMTNVMNVKRLKGKEIET